MLAYLVNYMGPNESYKTSWVWSECIKVMLFLLVDCFIKLKWYRMCPSGYTIVWVKGLAERNVKQGRDIGLLSMFTEENEIRGLLEMC